MSIFGRVLRKLCPTLYKKFKEHFDLLKTVKKQNEAIMKQIGDLENQTNGIRKLLEENLWAATFNNTIAGSKWLSDLPLSPGHWAMGYPELYVLYRILDDTKPQRILELGLGQSTKMISRYAAAHPNVTHYVVEHDPSWIAFFQNNFPLTEYSQIIQLDLEMIPYSTEQNVRAYKGFQDRFKGMKFDFICVDGPLAADMPVLGRIDILTILPESLSEDFIILIDDSERDGERHMIDLIQQVLSDNDTAYMLGRYGGIKDCTLICAEHMGFLTSM